MISIDVSKCDGCGDCVRVCPVDVLEMVGDRPVQVHEDECTKCGTCYYVCEMDAIKAED